MADPIGILTTERYAPYGSFTDRARRLRDEPEPLNFTPRAMELGRDLLSYLYSDASQFREENFVDVDVRLRMRDWLIESGKLLELMEPHLPAGAPIPTLDQQVGLVDFVFAFFATKLVEIHDDVVLRCVDLSEHPSGDPLPTYHRPTPLGLDEEAR